MEVHHSSSGILLSQSKYIHDLLSKNGFQNCKPVSTPINPKLKLTLFDGELLFDPTEYSRLKNSPLTLTGYSDVDLASGPDTYYSVMGYCYFIGSNLITWAAKKQPTFSRSNSEAEYRAISSIAAEILWFQSLFKELGILLSSPVT
uniref:Uncharacterized mitochondrial protein AtMg00810-like n=1 Tax=Nicotiana tabacum TaxID=4097 RepID=A0A1S3ZT89_TOBAC